MIIYQLLSKAGYAYNLPMRLGLIEVDSQWYLMEN